MTSCAICMTKFGLFNKQGSCALCGRFVCNKCSSSKVKIPGTDKPEKVCFPCQNELRTNKEGKEKGTKESSEKPTELQNKCLDKQPDELPRWYRQQLYPEACKDHPPLVQFPSHSKMYQEQDLPRWLAEQNQDDQAKAKPSLPRKAAETIRHLKQRHANVFQPLTQNQKSQPTQNKTKRTSREDLEKRFDDIFKKNLNAPKVSKEELLARYEKLTGQSLHTEKIGNEEGWHANLQDLSDGELEDLLVKEAQDAVSLEQANDTFADDPEEQRLVEMTNQLIADEERRMRKDDPSDATFSFEQLDPDRKSARELQSATQPNPARCSSTQQHLTNDPSLGIESIHEDLQALMREFDDESDASVKDISNSDIKSLLSQVDNVLLEVRDRNANYPSSQDVSKAPSYPNQYTRSDTENNSKHADRDSFSSIPKNVHDAYQYLNSHPLMWLFQHRLDADVVPEIFLKPSSNSISMCDIHKKMIAGMYSDSSHLQSDVIKMLETAVHVHGTLSIFGKYAQAILNDLATGSIDDHSNKK